MVADWIHKDCGGIVESELGYSDAERDYYFPVCLTCHATLELKDCVKLTTVNSNAR